MMRERITEQIGETINNLQHTLKDEKFMAAIEQAVRLMCEAFSHGGQVLFCGNGGSAADAQHFAAELSGRFNIDRAPLNAEALHVNTSYLTAVANDYGYEEVFARMVRARGEAGDVLFAISTSGNSPNIIRAAEAARELGMAVIGLSGRSGGKLIKSCDLMIHASADHTPRIQEIHLMAGHLICDLVEWKLFAND